MDIAQTDVKNEIDVIVRGDGTYLTIKHPEGIPWVSRMEVLSIIESYGVSDVDYVSLNDMLKKETDELDFKISGNTTIIQVKETASIEVSKDKMEAYIIFSPPVNKGEQMSVFDVVELLKSAGIVDPDSDTINSVLKNKRYEQKYKIAEGTLPQPGVDGSLKYHFDNSSLRPKPKIMDDGTVNFRQLGLLRLCDRGDILVTAIPAKDGVNGGDVYGNVLPYVKGKAPAPIPRGKNTVLSNDGLNLIADASGQLVIADNKINISPCLEIKGNVDNSTGDIDFNGTVTVHGNVITGFTVKAVGTIEVFGVCEGAKLITDANIVLGSGAQGSDKAELIAKGDITAKFIESCKVAAGGNIMADSILNSTVKCDGDVILSGKNGLLVGGSLIAGNKLTAKTIGSPMGTQTEIEVGNNPQQLLMHRQITGDLEKMKSDYEKCELAINTLNELKQKNQLTDDKKTLLIKMINMRMTLREKINMLQTDIDRLAKELLTSTGSISAAKIIRPGVRVTIGNSQLMIRDELSRCTLTNNGIKISIGPMI